MARIHIHHLPAAEGLTAAQEELVLGAGLPSFRPTFEALEERQQMASNLAGALPVQPPVLDVGHVSLRQFVTTPGDPSPQRMQGRLLGAQEDEVAKLVAREPDKKFADIIGANRFDNKWMLQAVSGLEQWCQPDGQIKVKLHFRYGVWSEGNWVKYGHGELYFKQDGMVGGFQSWKFNEANNLNWEGVFSEDKGKLLTRIKDVYRGMSVRAGTVYDEGAAIQTLAQRVEAILHAHGLFPNSNLKSDGNEPRAGGGLRIWVRLPDSRLQLDFDYKGQQGPADVFELQSVSRWRDLGKGKWEQIGLDGNVASALKGARYTVNHGDRARDQADGKVFADRALQTILARANAASGQTAYGYRIGGVTGAVERVELTDEGIRVVFQVQARMQYKSDPNIQTTLASRITLDLKLGGDANGMTQYRCTGANHTFDAEWNGGSRTNDYSYETVFGLSEAGLQQDFKSWSYYRVNMDQVKQAIVNRLSPVLQGKANLIFNQSWDWPVGDGRFMTGWELRGPWGGGSGFVVDLTGASYDPTTGLVHFSVSVQMTGGGNLLRDR
jgi:hypothetical protein